jgi:pimeloyl-ACP methyl ester carboxylesterase
VESSTVCPTGLIQTSYGPLEYAVLGEGLPLVVMHGSGGGVRQGLVMRYLLDTRRIKIVALSRPGYWGTPLETAPEIEQQADRVVELLDALRIETVAVLGLSAGGPPAAHFALRHPERCLGLVLLSALLPPPNARLARMIRSMPVMFRVLGFSDWPLRVFIAFVRRVILPLMGLLNIRRLAQDEARRMISESVRRDDSGQPVARRDAQRPPAAGKNSFGFRGLPRTNLDRPRHSRSRRRV